ncbi:MAG: aminotransferase class V-fold PLP-dependent enzyme [Gemmatimonadetes bacterium]|nr:aminotransferase class V-fold PLP-dependent enzyme [Gemmatimonadota bacterium]
MEPISAPPSIDVAELRAREFPHLGDSVYLNAASVAPLPRSAAREVACFNDRRERIHELTEADFSEPLRRSRAAAAALIGAGIDEIALGWNTSFGINIAALGISGEPGRTIVVSEREFPANVYPWMSRKDFHLDIVPTNENGWPDEDRILERLDLPGVAVFALSSVQFASGYLADLEKFGHFCRERGIIFVVDAIQSLGQVPIDVRAAKIDVLAAGGHKWLLSPFGTGFAYVRRELHDLLTPRVIGWTSMAASADFASLTDYRWEFMEGARRYEVATLPFQDFAGFAASLELLEEVGVERVRSHQEEILRPLLTWLQDHPRVKVASDLRPERRSGILSIQPPRAERVFEALTAAGVTCVLREGAIRLSPHLYNLRSEIEGVIEILSAQGDNGWS